MLKLFNPATAADVSTNGVDYASPQTLMLNILIELRVTNAILLDQQRGVVTQTLDQYRSDVVNSASNPGT